ncbi:MAG: NAD(+)/NADH kinase [Aggregatilineales bacterium]
MFKRVGILGHPLRPATGELCSAVAHSLAQRGISTWCNPKWDAQSVRPLIAESDLVIAIGGDGSMLRAARVCSEYGVPVFGINVGYLGFLTEASLNDWDALLGDLLGGGYWIEERMMIHAQAWRGESLLAEGDALNDVVVSRGAVAKGILLDAFIDGDWTTQYNADGLIIATPTGSTAYALAVGGPILPPTLKNILVVPVAPHLTLDRPIVLAEGATIDVIVAPRTTTDVTLTLDGESLCNLVPNDSVTVYASEHISRFVRLRERNYFYRSLLDRMEPRLSPRPQGAPPRRSLLERKA